MIIIIIMFRFLSACMNFFNNRNWIYRTSILHIANINMFMAVALKIMFLLNCCCKWWEGMASIKSKCLYAPGLCGKNKKTGFRTVSQCEFNCIKYSAE